MIVKVTPAPGEWDAFQWGGVNMREAAEFCKGALIGRNSGQLLVLGMDGPITVPVGYWVYRAPGEGNDTVGVVSPRRFAFITRVTL
jgi:hypothetical protein